jgi:hypothetical protein
MNPPWKKYQETCAKFFRDLGLIAEVEKAVNGVRGSHIVDVLVTGTISGIGLTWVIECKAWKTNIPKEKVLTLVSIVQDIGADKGILLSEVGFQSGAIRSAKGTNVLLTSIKDLKDQVQDKLFESTIARLHWRLTQVTKRLYVSYNDSRFHISSQEQLIKIMFLEHAFDEALQGCFPTMYTRIPCPNEQRFYAHSFDELVEVSNALLSEAEAFAYKYEANATIGSS